MLRALFSFILFLFCLIPNISLAQDASLFFGTPPKQVEVGDRFSLDVKVKSINQAINAVSALVVYPSDLLKIISISRDNTIMNFWTADPRFIKDKISFEGVIMNPGFLGNNGLIFKVTFEARNTGIAYINFTEGALLANDGLGSNVLATLGSVKTKIIPNQVLPDKSVVIKSEEKPGIAQIEPSKIVALPVITEYPLSVESKDKFYIKGKGEPNSLTRIVFKDVANKSVGERFISTLQTKKKKLDDALVKNDINGAFEYVSPVNLVAGVYNATPFLVDEDLNVEKPGFGAQLLVSDSKIVKALVVLINVLGLMIPIVVLCVVIYFIPWYSWLKMRIIKKKLGLEEEKILVSGHQIERQDKILDNTVEKITNPKTEANQYNNDTKI